MRWIERHILAFRAIAVFFIVWVVFFTGGLIAINVSRSHIVQRGGKYAWGGPLMFDFGFAMTAGIVALLIVLLAATADWK